MNRLSRYIPAGESLTDSAYQHECQSAILHFLVPCHVVKKGSRGKRTTQI